MARQLDERDEHEVCIECGAEIEPDIDRSFACAPDELLCFACAERRGGVYDERQDRWVLPPDVTGLPDERRPHP